MRDFLTRTSELITPAVPADGHGGGDAGLMDAFVAALASHLAVFAAERARLNGTVEPISN